jgi:hypothetical protein
MSYSDQMRGKGIWCPLKELYFPQLFAFTGRACDDDGTPLDQMYTLDQKVPTFHSGNLAAVPIYRIERNGPIGRRIHSLVLRHHDSLDRAVGYLNGVEDTLNTCDFATLHILPYGYFTLLLRPTACNWPSPMIFYVAEAHGDGTQRFEVGVASDGEPRATDLLGTE